MPKIITVPKNKQAEYDLDYNIAKNEQLVELEITDDEFNQLWENGVFFMINDIASCNIDEFEDDCIQDTVAIEKILHELKESDLDLKSIEKMFELALKYNTSIHFYF